MVVVLQLIGFVAIPANVTVLDCWVDPKFVPVIVTKVVAGPVFGDRPAMLGAGGAVTVNVLSLLLATLLTVTTTASEPTGALEGTEITMEVALQVAAVP
ncbi:MAG TPA: hypothetical protein VJR26_10585, partial [Candidatus Acidoferrales bacterium]|nr:hypothetical protein [Candidatus Acidoferrales bacterium]